MDKERHTQIGHLKKYPEFFALKQELEEFCDELDSIRDIDISETSRVTLTEEVVGRRFASERVRDLLSSLGLIDVKRQVRDKTME